MKLKRILALILTAQMLLVNAASCTKDEPEETKDTTKSPSETSISETAPAEEENPRLAVSDDLPEADFEGRDFRFLVQGGKGYEDQILAEDYGISVTSDAIYDRNQRISERYNTKITVILTDNESQDAMTQYAQVDEHIAEVCAMEQYMAMTPLCYGCYSNWADIPYVNFEKPWWNKDSIDSSTVNGQFYTVTGALALTAMQMTFCLAFNMDMMEDWGYPAETLYNLVWDGKWTYDKLIEITSDIYRDNNQNGERDSGDTFGYGACFYRSLPWATTIDVHPLTIAENGKSFVVTLATEKTYSFLEKMINFHHNTIGANNNSTFEDFTNGYVGIQTTTFENCYTIFRDMSFSYGLLPFPKYDETQENYYTAPNVNFSIFGLPSTLPIEDYEFVGIMMEVLNAESWKTVYPAFYDDALKGAYSTDPNMAKMVDLITDSRVYEFCVQFGQFLGGFKLPYMAAQYIYDGNLTMASDLAEQHNYFQTTFADLLTYFDVESDYIPEELRRPDETDTAQ